MKERMAIKMAVDMMEMMTSTRSQCVWSFNSRR